MLKNFASRRARLNDFKQCRYNVRQKQGQKMENIILELQEENLYFETMEELERYYANIDAVKKLVF